MQAFIDTSTLVKKYKAEPGRDKLLQWLNTADEIIISPITYFELICTIRREFETHKRGDKEFHKIFKEIDIDFGYFHKVSLNEELHRAAFDIRKRYRLKSLDLIQMASARISQSKIFLTSDKVLYKIGLKELKNHRVELIL